MEKAAGHALGGFHASMVSGAVDRASCDHPFVPSPEWIVRALVPIVLAASVLGCAGSSRPTADVVDVSVPAAPSAEAAPVPDSPAPRRAAAPPATPVGVERKSSSTEDVAAARALFIEGVQAYSMADYARARMLFSHAYAAAPRPQVLYNLADCELLLGDRQAACEHLEQFWMEGPATEHPKLLAKFGTTCPHLAQLP